ncbi:MAG: type IV pilus modification protein PilV [Proteobacteria bacterium]|nr:type IV pilus modification protein PilV [Pseudomonadota bacterium]
MIRSAPVRAVRGVSLIEVLVAIVIFSLGLLGLALMELKGATFTKEAGARTTAILQARSLSDRMQANPAGVAAGDYVWTQPGKPTMEVPCSGGSLADCTALNDIAEWLSQIQASAPASATGKNFGTVTLNPDGSYTITVSWNGLLDMTGSGTPTDVSESVIFYPTGIGAGS